MDYILIIKASLILASVGLALGLGLAVASKKFHVEVDETVEKILNALPGGNCGACGLPGCAAAAEAIFKGEVPPTACTAGGSSTAEEVAAILGQEVDVTAEVTVSFPHCNGGRRVVDSRFDYTHPVKDCVAADQIAGGDLKCPYGCLGYETCVRECPFDAIEMVDGLPRVIPEKCTSCEICVSACPRKLFSIEKADISIYMGCNSSDKGKDVRKYCKVGCISCKTCEKACPKDAIKVIDELAVIDQAKCDGCKACVEKCPTKCILVNDTKVTAQATAKKVESKPASHCTDLPENA